MIQLPVSPRKALPADHDDPWRDFSSSSSAALDMQISATVTSSAQAPNSSQDSRPVFRKAVSSPMTPPGGSPMPQSPRSTPRRNADESRSMQALVPLAGETHTAFYARVSEQQMVTQLDQVSLMGAEARRRARGVKTGVHAILVSSRREMRFALQQAAADAQRAHVARLAAPPEQLTEWPASQFTLGSLCAASIHEMLLFDDDQQPSAQAPIIDSSTFELLGQLRDLMSMSRQDRCVLYSPSDEAVRQRIMGVLIGAVMRNCPEAFIDEPVADTEKEDARQLQRWRYRYAYDLVAGGNIIPPLDPPSTPNGARSVRTFFGKKWPDALAWLNDSSLSPSQNWV